MHGIIFILYNPFERVKLTPKIFNILSSFKYNFVSEFFFFITDK